jgi:hypothetical protein
MLAVWSWPDWSVGEHMGTDRVNHPVNGSQTIWFTASLHLPHFLRVAIGNPSAFCFRVPMEIEE